MRQVRLAAEAIAKAQQAADHGRPRHHAERRHRAVPRLRREDRHPGRLHAARSRHVPGVASARSRSDGHARAPARQRRARRVRSADQHRRALRRPGDRPVSGFAPKAKIVHVDIDPAEIGKNVRTDVPVVGDAQRSAEAADARGRAAQTTTTGWPGSTRGATGRWTRRWRSGRNGRSRTRSSRRSPRRPDGEAIVTTDVGQHQMWAAQHFGFDHPEPLDHVWRAGHDGLRTAVGHRRQDRPTRPRSVGGHRRRRLPDVEQRAGDRGAGKARHQYRGHQQRLSRHGPPVAGSLPRQELLRGARSAAPNFEKLAEAYGITGITVRSDAEIRPAIERARAITGPVLIDFVIEPEANVWPIVPPGAANSEMMHQQRFED